MNGFTNKIGSWLSVLVVGGALGAVGCGDNQGVDFQPRDTPSPLLPLPEDVAQNPDEFFVPNGPDVPDIANRFVKNPTNPDELIYLPNEDTGGVFVWAARDAGGYAVMTSDTAGGSAQVLARTSYRPTNLLGDDLSVFWSAANRGEIYAYDREFGGVENIHTLGNAVTAMALDGNFLYLGLADGSISIGDRGAGQTAPLSSASGIPNRLVRQGDSVLWTTSSDGSAGGALYDYNLEKDTTTPLLSGFFFDTGFEADDASIYWADARNRAIMAVDRFGGEPTAMTEAEYGLSAVTSDRFYVYFATASDNQVKAVAKNGGPTIALGGGTADVSDLVISDDNRLFLIDLDFIYFLNL